MNPHKTVADGYVTNPFAFVTLDESFFWMLHYDTNLSMGRVLDVVWYDLNVTEA